jgi:hypothetical protein
VVAPPPAQIPALRRAEARRQVRWGPGFSSDDERAIFAKLTGRERESPRPVEEFLAVVGLRGGKSRALATLAAYISVCAA